MRWWGRNSARPHSRPGPPVDCTLEYTTSRARSSNPRCNPNKPRLFRPSPLTPSSCSLPSFLWYYLVSSLHRRADRAPDQLKRSAITWFTSSTHSVRRASSFVFLFFFGALRSLFLLTSSSLSSSSRFPSPRSPASFFPLLSRSHYISYFSSLSLFFFFILFLSLCDSSAFVATYPRARARDRAKNLLSGSPRAQSGGDITNDREILVTSLRRETLFSRFCTSQ